VLQFQYRVNHQPISMTQIQREKVRTNDFNDVR